MSEFFPDGTVIDSWFYNDKIPNINDENNLYYLDEHINKENEIHTCEFQMLIDKIHQNGGGTIIVNGVYKIGAIFLKDKVNLYINEDSMLVGSDDISDYPVMETRIEGENCMYYPALINVDNVDNVFIGGNGSINGNGLKSWKAFWQRRKWNPNCLNKDEQRPRLLYISNSNNVTIFNLKLFDSHFWTNHIYKCNKIRFLNLKISSPAEPIKAPSTDAIDIDVCKDILIKGCYMSVNDDAIVLKGGKGPFADTDPNNGINERILIEDCEFGFCHSCLTCGSESIHNRNILFRNSKCDKAKNLLWLKMRPDTPQKYEYIKVEKIKGNANVFLYIKPWTQFFDLKGRKDIPMSYAENIIMKNIDLSCKTFFGVSKAVEQYKLSNFILENLNIITKKNGYKEDVIENLITNNVSITEIPYEVD
jgi:polygalacturonase